MDKEKGNNMSNVVRLVKEEEVFDILNEASIFVDRKNIIKQRAKDKAKEWYHGNKEKSKIYNKEWKRKNKKRRDELNKKSYLKQKYGLTLDQYLTIKIQQNNKCAVCIQEKKLDIDHCHTTGRIRQLLCANCNRMLGMAKENITTLTNAINYLNKWNK